MRQLNFVALGDVAEVTAGGGAPQEDKFFTEEGFPFIRAGSLIKLLNNEGESSLEQINEDNAKIHGLKLYPKDSVLFAKSGMSATKGHVYRTKQPCYVVNHLAVIIPNMLCDASYIEKVLKKYPPVSLIQDPAYPSIRLSDIAKLKIPLPPLAEQKRIAAVLDKAAEIKVNRELAIEKLESFIASLFDAMQLAENFETKSTIRDLTKKASLTPITDKSVWSLSLEQIDANTGNINDCVMVDISELGSSTYFFSPPVVLYSKLRPYLNKVALPESNGFATTELVPLYCDEKKYCLNTWLPIYVHQNLWNSQTRTQQVQKCRE
jgi:type I restriction enzyme S subunit